MENGSKEKKPMGLAERFLNIFVSPTETFVSVMKKPTWWLPFIVIILIAVLSLFMNKDINNSDQEKIGIVIMKKMNMTEQQIDEASKQPKPGFSATIINCIVIISILTFSTAALILLGIKIVGGKANFNQVLGVINWSGLLTMLGDILKSFLIHAQGTYYGVTTSLSALTSLPKIGDSINIPYMLLSKTNPFMIWQVILWAIGVSVVANIKIKTSVLTVCAVWAIGILLSIGINSLVGIYLFL